MKLDFSKQLYDLKRKKIKTPGPFVEDIGEFVTLQGAGYLALMKFEQGEDGVKKYKSHELCKKIHTDGEVELTSEEVVYLKEKLGSFWSPDVIGAAYDALEGKDVGLKVVG